MLIILVMWNTPVCTVKNILLVVISSNSHHIHLDKGGYTILRLIGEGEKLKLEGNSEILVQQPSPYVNIL